MRSFGGGLRSVRGRGLRLMSAVFSRRFGRRRAGRREVDADPGPDAGSLVGKRIGVRYDSAWKSYEWVIDEWIPRLRGAGDLE